jgi:heparosan-N-sulfate-glucuronate 5-epimerase
VTEQSAPPPAPDHLSGRRAGYQPPADASRLAAVFHATRRGYQAMRGTGHAFTHQPLGRRIDPHGLQGYWCDLRHKAYWATRWGGGFPSLGPRGPLAPYVIPVAQTALGYWELLLEGRDTAREFLRLADWLVDNSESGPVGVIWRTNLPQRKYGLEPGWTTAMGQGEAISVLLRAHAMTGADHYLALARAAFEPLTLDVAAGGLSRRVDGQMVLEEYPSERPCAVLNGWIFAVLGVHELVNITGDAQVRRIRDESASGIVALLPRYDIGWWSLYSLYDHGRPDLAKPFYQRLHPVMLDALHLARPDPALPRMARRWEAQITSLALARVAVDKPLFRLHRWRGDRPVDG